MNHSLNSDSVVCGVLHKPSDFSAALSSKSLKRTSLLSLYLSRLDSSVVPLISQANLGLIVSKRVDKRSVRRNLVKRVIRAWFFRHGRLFVGYNLVLRVHADVSGLTQTQLKRQLWLELRQIEFDVALIFKRFCARFE